jgi:hypothetical protein
VAGSIFRVFGPFHLGVQRELHCPVVVGFPNAIERDMTSAGFDLKLQVIDHIAKATSIAESAIAFKLFEKELTGCRFVFAADLGGQPGFAVGKTFSSGAAIRSLFQSERVLVLDHNSVAAPEGGYDYASGDDHPSHPLFRHYGEKELSDGDQ